MHNNPQARQTGIIKGSCATILLSVHVEHNISSLEVHSLQAGQVPQKTAGKTSNEGKNREGMHTRPRKKYGTVLQR